MSAKEEFEKSVLKHLQGRHNQKRHGYRGASSSAGFYRTLDKARGQERQYVLSSSAKKGVAPFNHLRERKLSQSEIDTVTEGLKIYSKKRGNTMVLDEWVKALENK